MITTHIDIEVLEDAIKKIKSNPLTCPKDFIDFLTKGTNLIIYNRNINTSDDTNANLMLLLEGAGKAPTKLNDKPYPFPYYSSSRNKEDPYQVYFLNIIDREEQKEFADRFKLLVGFINNYYEVFTDFKKEPFFRVDDSIEDNKFSSWEEVLPELPVTDVIISDPYLLNYRMANPLENNYFNLIRTIKICYPNIENLLIYSYIDKERNMDNEDTAYKSILSDIISQTDKIIGNQFSFRLLILTKEIHKITGFEHDRHIFMNYNHIRLGGSINFLFNKNNELDIKNKSTIKVHSYYNPDNYFESLVVLELLKDIREQSNLNKRIPQHLKDITSNLFNFLSNFTINPKYIKKLMTK